MDLTILNEENFNACLSGYEFANTHGSLLEAWNNCERGDWMLWFAKKLDCDNRLMTLAKGKCAETVIHLMKDQRSIDCVKAAIDFGNFLIGEDELETYRAAAYAAYADSAADAAAAAYAAAYAAYADSAAAYAAAAYAADAAADAAAAYAAYARTKSRKQTADICRTILTDFIKTKINE